MRLIASLVADESTIKIFVGCSPVHIMYTTLPNCIYLEEEAAQEETRRNQEETRRKPCHVAAATLSPPPPPPPPPPCRSTDTWVYRYIDSQGMTVCVCQECSNHFPL